MLLLPKILSFFIYRAKRERRRKEKFREDNCFYRLPTKRLCASCVLSAAEAKNFHDSENFPLERETRFLLFLLFACFSIFFHNAHLFPSLFFYSRRRCALTTTALNLLPVGQLDGGRIAQAAFGRRVLSATSLGTYLGLTFGILGSTLSLPWLLFIVICQRTPDYAPKDDVTEVGESRATLAFACIAIAFLILLPGSSLVPSDLGPLDF